MGYFPKIDLRQCKFKATRPGPSQDSSILE